MAHFFPVRPDPGDRFHRPRLPGRPDLAPGHRPGGHRCVAATLIRLVHRQARPDQAGRRVQHRHRHHLRLSCCSPLCSLKEQGSPFLCYFLKPQPLKPAHAHTSPEECSLLRAFPMPGDTAGGFFGASPRRWGAGPGCGRAAGWAPPWVPGGLVFPVRIWERLPGGAGRWGSRFVLFPWGRGAESRPGSGGVSPRFPGTRGFHQFGFLM